MRKIQVIAMASFLALGGCASTGGSMEGGSKVTKEAVEKTIKEAEAAVKAAAGVGSEWRDSGKFIKQAKAALSKGDLETAMKKAKKAKGEGNMAKTQGEGQAKAGPWLF